MTDNLRKKCELFEKNRNAISRKFLFENAFMSIAAGLLFTGANKEADTDRLKECRKILKDHTGAFSEYRDVVELALISEMALSLDADQYISDVKEVYKKLHKGKFLDNSYMVLAAMLICDLRRQNNPDEIVEKHNTIIKQMKKEYPHITDSADISFVILLALSDRSVEAILSDMNECYDYLKKTQKIKISADSIQGLGEILALTDGDMKLKCDKAIRVYDALKENKSGIGDGAVFSSLGTLTYIDEEPDVLAGEILEVSDFLKSLRGFDEQTVNRNLRLMFAEILVAQSYGASNEVLSNAFINSALGVVLAQRIGTMITVISNMIPAVLGVVIDKDDNNSGDSQTKPSN